MPDETTTTNAVDVIVPLPGDGNMPAAAGAVDATIDKVLDQAFAKTHEVWLSTMEFSNQGMQLINEVDRWSMQAAATNQTFLASGILSQRSAQAQPQQQPGPGGTGVPAGMKLVPV